MVGFNRPFYFLVILAVISVSCESRDENKVESYDYYLAKTSLNYAKGFKVSYFHSYKIVDVFDDLDSSKLVKRYFLVEQGTRIPEMKANEQLIRVPIASTACLSTTQVAYLAALNQVDKISGVGYASSIMDSLVKKQINDGWTMEITRSGQLDIELILQANTSLLMANTFDQLSVASLSELDIPVIFSAEYLENDVLARAEWIKFFALFFNAEKKANQLFVSIEKEYLDAKKKIELNTNKPLIMFGSYYQGTWFVPGGKSLISGLFNDAGASYLFNSNESRNNIHVDTESLIEKMDQIDYWGMVLSKEEAISENDFLEGDLRMKELALDQNMHFFYSNAVQSDYFGKAYIEPHVLLKDLGKIFHPSLFNEHQFVYFQSHNK
jgi:iron complex transport system substrate-binding protein